MDDLDILEEQRRGELRREIPQLEEEQNDLNQQLEPLDQACMDKSSTEYQHIQERKQQIEDALERLKEALKHLKKECRVLEEIHQLKEERKELNQLLRSLKDALTNQSSLQYKLFQERKLRIKDKLKRLRRSLGSARRQRNVEQTRERQVRHGHRQREENQSTRADNNNPVSLTSINKRRSLNHFNPVWVLFRHGFIPSIRLSTDST